MTKFTHFCYFLHSFVHFVNFPLLAGYSKFLPVPPGGALSLRALLNISFHLTFLHAIITNFSVYFAVYYKRPGLVCYFLICISVWSEKLASGRYLIYRTNAVDQTSHRNYLLRKWQSHVFIVCLVHQECSAPNVKLTI